MTKANISSVGIMGVEDPTVNEKIELAAFMLPSSTLAKLRAYAASTGDSQHSVLASAIEQYINVRTKKQ